MYQNRANLIGFVGQDVEATSTVNGGSEPQTGGAVAPERTGRKSDEAKKLCDDALDRLMAALEQGKSDALKAYLAVMSRFHKYSWGNCLLIYSQKPEATHVAGFHAWLTLRRYVRKGEKGIVILAPMVGKKKTESELTEDEQTRVFGFRAAHVFDVSQTEGEPLPEFATVRGDPQNYTVRMKAFVTGKGIGWNIQSGLRRRRACLPEARSRCFRVLIRPRLSPYSCTRLHTNCCTGVSGGRKQLTRSGRPKRKR